VFNFIDRNILAICSGMTAVCGLAQNFTMLLLARIGVAIGARTRQR
jgi:predicted MFS family arabinose efflux permease